MRLLLFWICLESKALHRYFFLPAIRLVCNLFVSTFIYSDSANLFWGIGRQKFSCSLHQCQGRKSLWSQHICGDPHISLAHTVSLHSLFLQCACPLCQSIEESAPGAAKGWYKEREERGISWDNSHRYDSSLDMFLPRTELTENDSVICISIIW